MTNLLNNRYQIQQTLARGGFGETFLAMDTYMPSSRKCVIKQLKPVVQYPVIPQWLQERFQREAAILEELGEKNEQIPRLYAYFSESANFYLVQEWIEGQTLTQLRQHEGNLSEEQVKKILLNLLPVLTFIHDRKIIHRDLKPDNIILRNRDGLPVLIDFGAMKEAVATVMDTAGHTTLSVVSGTPGYMASEQAAGRPVYSSDLYGLGLTAIYLLTGKTPQELETDPTTGEILWRKQANHLHSNLASVIDRAVRFHPRDRFSNATDMLQALKVGESIVEPTIAVSPGTPQTVVVKPTRPVTVPVIEPSQLEERPRKSPLGCFLPTLLFLGLIFSAFFLGFRAFLPKFPERPEPTPTPEASPTPTPSPIFTPTPRPEPTPTPEATPIPTPEPTPTPESIPIPVPPPEEPPTPEPTQEPELIPTPEPEVTPTPEPTPEITPIPEPEVTPIPEPEPPQTQSQYYSPKVPIFPVGTVKSAVINQLGTPTFIKKGLWGDSQAVRYQDLIPNQVDLGYLIDNQTGQIRQTEVSFTPAVSLKTMQKTLSQLLSGNSTPLVKQGLQQVYDGQKQRYSFNVGSLKGTIERQKSNNIYIGIWDANFH